MKKLKHVVGAIAVALVIPFAGAHSAEIEGVKMSKSEVTAMFSGKTDVWQSGNGASYTGPDGTYLFKFKGNRGQGNWSVSDSGTLCLKVQKWWGDKNNCNWEYYKVGDIIKHRDIKKDTLVILDMKNITEGNSL
ncbi:MAG: DUF995 domain-containing protein [Sneathiella sp.]